MQSGCVVEVETGRVWDSQLRAVLDLGVPIGLFQKAIETGCPIRGKTYDLVELKRKRRIRDTYVVSIQDRDRHRITALKARWGCSTAEVIHKVLLAFEERDCDG